MIRSRKFSTPWIFYRAANDFGTFGLVSSLHRVPSHWLSNLTKALGIGQYILVRSAISSPNLPPPSPTPFEKKPSIYFLDRNKQLSATSIYLFYRPRCPEGEAMGLDNTFDTFWRYVLTLHILVFPYPWWECRRCYTTSCLTDVIIRHIHTLKYEVTCEIL